MTKEQHKQLQFYESPRVETLSCEAWSGICAQSVVTEVQYNELMDVGQEIGETIDMSASGFNHEWEEGE